MAMLAEPRQRKRYNLIPRGKALYEDDSRFGTKMLEKMGWSKGKGLGVKLDGSQDFVRIRYKNDAQGFGYEQRDDQWTQHEDVFNGLLKTLNGEENAGEAVVSNMSTERSNDSEDMPRVGFGFQDPGVKEDNKKKANKTLKLKEKISGISLEERSKQSKARVHYKKFTKGKDLAQYSEKDLANIFGKKVVDEQQQAVNDFYQQLNNTFKENDEVSDEDCDGKIINTGVSVTDYFKKKMEGIKNRQKGKNNIENEIEKDIFTEILEEDVSKKKKKKKKDNKDNEQKEENNKNIENDEPSNKIFNSGVSVADYFKQKMEEMKNRRNATIQENKIEEDISTVVPEEKVAKKKKIKENKCRELEEEIKNNYEEEPPTKKSKKRGADILQYSPKEENETATKSKKEKKKKEIPKHEHDLEILPEENAKKRKNEVDTLVECIDEIDLTQEPQKKKKKTNKVSEIIEIDESILDDATSTTEKKKKSKSKSKQEAVKEEELLSNDETSVQKPKKSKGKDVSSVTKQQPVATQALTLDDLKNKYNSFNIYEISSFSAEKFRNINLNHFTGSTLPQVDGYAFSTDNQLNVKINKNDEERITNLWKNTLDKYSQLEKPKKTYHHYIKEVIKARKTKQKRPKLHVKTWKRKNAFQII